MSAGTVVVWAFAGEADSTRKVEANIRTTKAKANIFTLELRQIICLLVSNMFSFISFFPLNLGWSFYFYGKN